MDTNVSELRWRFREAAAVLSYFDPTTLVPTGGTEAAAKSAEDQLRQDVSVDLNGPTGTRWILRADVRKQALKRLGTREAMQRALALNHSPAADPLQLALEALIGGLRDVPRSLDLERLRGIVQVVDWMHGIVDGLPDVALLGERVERATLLKPLQLLVGQRFFGRGGELSRLRNFCQSPTGPADKLNSSALPLLIFGLGGIGKSTLIAHFVLNNVEFEEFGFAFIDFERPGFAEQPLEIAREAARQLAIQDPSLKAALLDVRHRSQAVLTANSDPNGVSSGLELDLIDSFGRLVNAMVAKMPTVLVLDTIERLQVQGPRIVQRLGDLLARLQQYAPALRIILISRLPIVEFRTQNLHLGELGPRDATAFLKSSGLDEAISHVLVERLGGNPLTLTLVANLVANGIWKDLDVSEISAILQVQNTASIQVILYHRVLNHIDDSEVRHLAYAGLVVRRITPEIIVSVLAEPSGLSRPTPEGAQRLFHRLKREVWMMQAAQDGSLRHRAELRSALLEPLSRDQPEMVRSIHESAVRYFETYSDDESRAEELYHRLALEQKSSELDARWIPSVGPLLASSVGELPPQSREYLRARSAPHIRLASQQSREERG